jgi:formiminotetrahydrofolate cyclodeaminase
VETLDAYLERLASKAPVPGGGSAAALVSAIGAGLVAMVGRIAGAPVDAVISQADRLRGELHAAAHHDEAAFAAVIAAQALPKRDDRERSARRQRLEQALEEAADAPLHAASLSLDVLRLAVGVLETHTGALASDIGCAAEFAFAGLAGSAYNVRINHRYMDNESAIRRQAATLARFETEAGEILAHVRSAVASATTPQ